ncbi:uncharacterized protein LOC111042733 [Myzus persicae]|uniref:uncharacterized protein LOC111042733 n=1 Tax=Myzus persicae TaxID=13164 RepID=UPI000B932581|nr:uncharacterized protein LOC111042733 [Myzus persicae]
MGAKRDLLQNNGANTLKAIHLFENEFETQVSENNDLEVGEKVYELVDDDSDSTSTSEDNNDNNSDLENVLMFNPSLDHEEISDLLNENFDDVDEPLDKTEKIVTDIAAQNVGGIRCVAHTLQLAITANRLPIASKLALLNKY